MGSRIGLKYCGGCMPAYDRTALVDTLKEKLAGKIDFVPWDDPDTTATLVIAGCPNACADIQAVRHKPIFFVKTPADARVFFNFIESGKIDELETLLPKDDHIGG